MPAAQEATWVREEKPSLEKRFSTWVATVRSLTNSPSAMARLGSAGQIQAATSTARRVSPPNPSRVRSGGVAPRGYR